MLSYVKIDKMNKAQPFRNPGVAAVLSFFIPGLGQIYNGQLKRGFAILVLQIINIALTAVFIGFITAPITAVFAVIDAYRSAVRLNSGQEPDKPNYIEITTTEASKKSSLNKKYFPIIIVIAAIASITLIGILLLVLSYTEQREEQNTSQNNPHQPIENGNRSRITGGEYFNYVQPIVIQAATIYRDAALLGTSLESHREFRINLLNEKKTVLEDSKNLLKETNTPSVFIDEHNSFISAIDDYIFAINTLLSAQDALDLNDVNIFQSKLNTASLYSEKATKKITDAFKSMTVKFQNMN